MTGQGSVVGMPEIARRAGVGQATLYRHFPDRSALAAAVVDQPAVFHQLLREVLHTQIAMRPLVVLARRLDPGVRLRYQRQLLAAFAEPLRRAQRAGYVRSDLVPDDLVLLSTMVQGVA